MASQLPFATPLADVGAWILLVPLVWFALALLFVFVLRRLGRGPGRGCGSGRRYRRWEDETPGPPGAAFRR
ncbi:MAG: hypothetical protein JSU06_06020 [Actinobacteria bacterium]|nr:hypothetical protein [Actinomycetota bacterium]